MEEFVEKDGVRMSKIVTGNEVVKSPLNDKKNFNGIDLIKFICSILVVAIHIKVFNASAFGKASLISNLMQFCIGRVAVPFFFVSSAFLLFRKMDISRIEVDVIKSYCFRILQLFAVWSILLVLGPAYHLWYLTALVVAVVMLSLCLRFNIKLKYLWILAAILYVIGLLGDAYAGVGAALQGAPVINVIVKVYTLFSETTRNGFFMGFIFVLMGCSFTRAKFRMKNSVVLAGFVLSMIGLTAEFYLLTRYDIPAENNMYVMLIPCVYFMFYLACNIKLRDRAIYKKLRAAGTLIYFLHLMVDAAARPFVHLLKDLTGIDLTGFRFFIVLGLSLLISLGLQGLSEKEKFKWLKWFY